MIISFDKLSPQKQRFLKSIGLTEDCIPSSFFDVIEAYRETFNSAERFMISGDDFKSTLRRFSMRDVVGTDHERYSGKTWFEAYIDLDRGDKMIEMYFNNPQYYDGLRKLDQSDLPHDTSISLVEKDGKYHLSRPGGGNNRMILMKIKYLALIEQANGDQSKMDEIDKQFTFVGKVKVLPKDKCTAQFYYGLNILLGMFDNNCINVSNTPDVPIFRIFAGATTFDSITEEQLPNVFEKITSTYDPDYLQDMYNTYKIDLGTQKLGAKK